MQPQPNVTDSSLRTVAHVAVSYAAVWAAEGKASEILYPKDQAHSTDAGKTALKSLSNML